MAKKKEVGLKIAGTIKETKEPEEVTFLRAEVSRLEVAKGLS